MAEQQTDYVRALDDVHRDMLEHGRGLWVARGVDFLSRDEATFTSLVEAHQKQLSVAASDAQIFAPFDGSQGGHADTEQALLERLAEEAESARTAVHSATQRDLVFCRLQENLRVYRAAKVLKEWRTCMASLALTGQGPLDTDFERVLATLGGLECPTPARPSSDRSACAAFIAILRAASLRCRDRTRDYRVARQRAAHEVNEEAREAQELRSQQIEVETWYELSFLLKEHRLLTTTCAEDVQAVASGLRASKDSKQAVKTAKRAAQAVMAFEVYLGAMVTDHALSFPYDAAAKAQLAREVGGPLEEALRSWEADSLCEDVGQRPEGLAPDEGRRGTVSDPWFEEPGEQGLSDVDEPSAEVTSGRGWGLWVVTIGLGVVLGWSGHALFDGSVEPVTVADSQDTDPVKPPPKQPLKGADSAPHSSSQVGEHSRYNTLSEWPDHGLKAALEERLSRQGAKALHELWGKTPEALKSAMMSGADEQEREDLTPHRLTYTVVIKDVLPDNVRDGGALSWDFDTSNGNRLSALRLQPKRPRGHGAFAELWAHLPGESVTSVEVGRRRIRQWRDGGLAFRLETRPSKPPVLTVAMARKGQWPRGDDREAAYRDYIHAKDLLGDKRTLHAHLDEIIRLNQASLEHFTGVGDAWVNLCHARYLKGEWRLALGACASASDHTDEVSVRVEALLWRAYTLKQTSRDNAAIALLVEARGLIRSSTYGKNFKGAISRHRAMWEGDYSESLLRKVLGEVGKHTGRQAGRKILREYGVSSVDELVALSREHGVSSPEALLQKSERDNLCRRAGPNDRAVCRGRL